MKIALVWPGEQPAVQLSFRFEHYVAGFAELGHEAFVVGRSLPGVDPPYPLEPVGSVEELSDSALWARLAVDVAIVFTWHRWSKLLVAIRSTGTRVVSIADTDGRVGLRAFPLVTLQQMFVYRKGVRSQIGCLKYWLTRFLTDGLRGGEEDREFVESTRASDVVILGSSDAAACFGKFLDYAGAAEFKSRLRAVPYAVPISFCTTPLDHPREDRVVSIGRWSDPQKNTPLLVAALERFLKRRCSTKVSLFGSGAIECFGELADRFPEVEIHGVQPLHVVQQTVRTSRSLLVSSRWESGPHTATEALALGATLIGTPIPAMVGLIEGGDWGRVSQRSSPNHFAKAMFDEMEAWDQGERRPLSIAETWRPRVSPTSVCSQLLEALDSIR